MNDLFPTGLAAAAALIVLIFVWRDHHAEPRPAQARSTPAPYVDEQKAESEAALQELRDSLREQDHYRLMEAAPPPPEPAECEAIELDGSPEQLRKRIQCNGIETIEWCEAREIDRRILESIGATGRKCP
jgi:hypothetical protein